LIPTSTFQILPTKLIHSPLWSRFAAYLGIGCAKFHVKAPPEWVERRMRLD